MISVLKTKNLYHIFCKSLSEHNIKYTQKHTKIIKFNDGSYELKG